MTTVKDVQYQINRLLDYGNQMQLPYNKIPRTNKTNEPNIFNTVNTILKEYCDDVSLYTIYSAGSLLIGIAQDLQKQLEACEIDMKI